MRDIIDVVEDVVSLMPADMVRYRRLHPTAVTLPEPFYIYGGPKEINYRLIRKKAEKYPVVMLILPVKDISRKDIHRVKVNIGFAMKTKEDITSPERYANTITPTLKPLYESFMRVVRSSGLFHQIGPVDHGRIDRMFLNEMLIAMEKKEGSKKSLFSDPLDAIEVVDLELRLIHNDC